MDLETLWNETLEALRAETPRASFETWLKDTRAVDYKDGALTVAARNAYARDWLEERMWVPLMQILRGKAEDIRDVRFVVEAVEAVEVEDEEGEPKTGERVSGAEAETILHRTAAAAADEVEISAEAYDSLYEQAVRPDRAVYLPGYFRRWLPILGPDLAWFYIGFRQAAYWSSGGRKSGVHSGRFSGRQIAALCGVTERTFWNRVGRLETWRKMDGLIGKDGQRYKVAVSLPLTGADARSLTRWLRAHLEEYGGPDGALEAACRTPLDELLNAEDEDKTEGVAPQTILQALRAVPLDLPEEHLRSAAERLRLHLMPQGDQIVISLFFLEHILPWLGAGAAWVYVLLRDRCFVDKTGVKNRDTVTVHGGYREIASWLGISRPRTVYDWLRDPIACVYLAGSIEQKNGAGWENNPIALRVLLNDVPAEIVQAATRQEKPKVFDANFSLGLLRFDAIFSDSCRDFQSCLTRFSVSFDANFSPHLTRISEFFDAIFSALKPLTLKTESLKPRLTDQPAFASEKNAGAAETSSVGRQPGDEPDSVSEWDFEGILNRLTVNPTSRRRLREENIPPENFLAWLLQAMTMRGVDPVRVAIAWTLDSRKRAGADEDFKLLARSPVELRRLARELATSGGFRYTLSLDTASPVCQAYRRRFGEGQDVAIALLRLLFGETIEFASPFAAEA